jgi:hypothetical protein
VALTPDLPDLPIPRREQFTSDLEYINALQMWRGRKAEFQGSAAGQAALRSSREYVAIPGADGSFAINDVIPGTYELKIISDSVVPGGKRQLRAPRLEEVLLMNFLDAMTREVIVPGTSGTDAAPFDCGLLAPNSKTP